MGDAVTSQTLFNGSKRTIRKFTNVSDGSGESAIKKIDISGLIGAPSRVIIDRIWYTVSPTMSVSILYDHTSAANDLAFLANGSGYQDFRSFGGLVNSVPTDGPNDILFTTHNHTSGETYTIILDVRIL